MWKCILMGPRPPSAWWPMKEKPKFSSADAIKAGEHEEGAPEGHSKEQSGVHPGCNLCPWSGSRSHSFVLVARGFAEGHGHVWEAREPSPKSPNERVEEAKARVARLEGASSCWVWTVQTQSQSKSLWKRRKVNVVFSLLENVSIRA